MGIINMSALFYDAYLRWSHFELAAVYFLL